MTHKQVTFRQARQAYDGILSPQFPEETNLKTTCPHAACREATVYPKKRTKIYPHVGKHSIEQKTGYGTGRPRVGQSLESQAKPRHSAEPTKALRISQYFNNNSIQKRSMLLVVGYLLGPFHTFLANWHNWENRHFYHVWLNQRTKWQFVLYVFLSLPEKHSTSKWHTSDLPADCLHAPAGAHAGCTGTSPRRVIPRVATGPWRGPISSAG